MHYFAVGHEILAGARAPSRALTNDPGGWVPCFAGAVVGCVESTDRLGGLNLAPWPLGTQGFVIGLCRTWTATPPILVFKQVRTRVTLVELDEGLLGESGCAA